MRIVPTEVTTTLSQGLFAIHQHEYKERRRTSFVKRVHWSLILLILQPAMVIDIQNVLCSVQIIHLEYHYQL
jgi:hypothetical protein